MLNTRELTQRVKNENERTKFVEEAADAGMPFSAYADSEYDPEKDSELGPDDERLSAMEVIQDELDMTTTCNPAAGIWPTRCENVIGDPAKEFRAQRDVSECVSERVLCPTSRLCCTETGTTRPLGTRWDIQQRL